MFKKKLVRLLHWSEKYIKTDMLYLAKGSFWLTIGHFFSASSSFILAIIFANFFPMETYGVYKYVLSVAGILGVTTLSGLNSALTHAIAKNYHGSIIPVIKTKIKWGLIGSFSSLLMSGHYFLSDNINLCLAFIIVAIFLPFMDSFGVYNDILEGRKKFKHVSIFGTVNQLIATLCIISAIVFSNSILVVLATYFFIWTFVHFISYLIVYKKFKTNNNFEPKTSSYGKHLSFISVFGIIVDYLDKLLIFHYIGAIELAIYSFAIAPIQQIKGLFKNQLAILALPKLAERSYEEINSTLVRRLSFLFGIGLSIVVAYILLAPFLFELLFPKYISSIFYSQLFAGTMIFVLPNSLFGAARLSKLTNTPIKSLYLWNLSSFIFLVFMVPLAILYGVVGIIISRYIFMVTNFFIGIMIWRKIGINIRSEINLKAE